MVPRPIKLSELYKTMNEQINLKSFSIVMEGMKDNVSFTSNYYPAITHRSERSLQVTTFHDAERTRIWKQYVFYRQYILFTEIEYEEDKIKEEKNKD
jgi:hypothetical protein